MKTKMLEYIDIKVAPYSKEYIDVKVAPYSKIIWNNIILEDGSLMYPSKIPGYSEEMMFDENHALVILIANNVVFLNDYWWKSESANWPDSACKTFSINVNCSDIFAWGCADSEDLLFHDLASLYDHYIKDPIFGSSIWCIKKRNMMPQKIIKDKIHKAGIWNLDEIGLIINPD